MRRRGSLRGETRVSIACFVAALLLGGVSSGRAQATAAPLVLPSAIVFDSQGNLYFAETGNHVVRRFSVAGVSTTIAGSGVEGFAGDGGPGTVAELDSPSGLAMDAAGDLYIADTHNHRVREVAAATGTISTVAGTGAAGFSGDGGPANSARLDLPTALAVDAAGNLYVADTDNHRVRRIAAATGLITTVAGSGVEGFAGDGGLASAAAIDSPNGLAVDPAGDLFISDTHNGRVREVSAATGMISTIAGVGMAAGNVQAFGGDGGAATVAGLALPRGLTLDAAGNLYVADSENHRVRMISAAGMITTVAGHGTEAFAGDGAPAVAASLDTPRALAMSPGGLLTLADSDNQRIRQLDALAAPDIHEIAALGTTAPGTLLLSGPSVVVYGSGSVTATLTAATLATGSVTFQDTVGGAVTTLGTGVLSADAASFSIGGLAAGAHSIVAIYAGDTSHIAAQSSALLLTVTPLGLVATANPAAILFGQPVPALSGVLSGVLARDAGRVAADFTAAAGALSPVGLYPIAATLTGSAAGNYSLPATALSVTAANLTIAQAPALTMLSASTANPGLGLPVALTMQAVSITSGVPTGSITLLDGTMVLSVVQLSGGAATVSTSTLAPGGHSLSAVYSGDANFLASTSATANIIVGAASDFVLTATGSTSQTIPAGNAATFNFSVAMQGTAMASPIALGVQGTPAGATASLNPNYVPPGGAVTSFTLTIQTPLVAMEGRSRPLAPGYSGSAVLAILLLPGIGFGRRLPQRLACGLPIISIVLMAASGLLFTTLVTGCGDRVDTASESVGAMSYTLIVTGTATTPAGTAVQHSANVTLKVL